MPEFDLKNNEFIELNKLLKIMGWVGTGGEAKIAIANEEVMVNNSAETQRRKKLRSGDLIQFRGEEVKVV